LQKISTILSKGKDAKIIVMVGAGISATSDGEPLIPDFRSPGTGLFYNLKKLDLPYPEAVFDIEFFRENPMPFFTLCKALHPSLVNFIPTRFHFFLKLLNDKTNLIRIFTQNIDCLERIAGIPEEKIVEAHGSFASNHCIKCNKKYDDSNIIIDAVNKKQPPLCTQTGCDGYIKPSIVFYGESLPERFHTCADSDFDQDIDLAIVAGTSLAVYPFANLASEVSKSCQRVLINNEKVGAFKSHPRKKDILSIGDCDKIADSLAALCGWKNELDELILNAHTSLNKQK
ncbi:histone deacetylase HST2, partial [Ascoidea rubescens DSM 1968]